jgi:hypothetical protein
MWIKFRRNAYIVRGTGETINVSGFIDSLGTFKRVPIATAAITYDDPVTYQTHILFFHQALYFDKMDKHLLSPAQMQENQGIVNEVPLLHLPYQDREHSSHSIITEPPHPQLHIPLFLNDATTGSCFWTRKPTRAEIQTDLACIHVHMTSDQSWYPNDASMEILRRSKGMLWI